MPWVRSHTLTEKNLLKLTSLKSSIITEVIKSNLNFYFGKTEVALATLINVEELVNTINAVSFLWDTHLRILSTALI
jgi:hypothetical protein